MKHIEAFDDEYTFEVGDEVVCLNNSKLTFLLSLSQTYIVSSVFFSPKDHSERCYVKKDDVEYGLPDGLFITRFQKEIDRDTKKYNI